MSKYFIPEKMSDKKLLSEHKHLEEKLLICRQNPGDNHPLRRKAIHAKQRLLEKEIDKRGLTNTLINGA